MEHSHMNGMEGIFSKEEGEEMVMVVVMTCNSMKVVVMRMVEVVNFNSMVEEEKEEVTCSSMKVVVVTPHLISKILSALGLLVHPCPGLPPRSSSWVCSWQPRMAPKRVLLVKVSMHL